MTEKIDFSRWSKWQSILLIEFQITTVISNETYFVKVRDLFFIMHELIVSTSAVK